MKKRFLSLIVILAVLISFSTAVFADVDRFVFDEQGRVTAEHVEELNALGARIYSETGVAVCACISDEVGDDIRGFAMQFYAEKIGVTEGILLVHDPAANLLTYVVSGEKLSSLSDEEITRFLDAYNTAKTYSEGIRDYMNLVYAHLLGTTAYGEVTPEDNPNIPAERVYPRVTDLAGVIDASSLSRLNTLADEISEKYRCDVAVAIVPSLGGKDVVSYADDFYDYNGIGYGADDDGILLLISVGDREFAESTYGYGKTAFTDYGLQQYIEPRFIEYIANGRDDWAGAAGQFIGDAGELLRQAREGRPYDNYQTPQPAVEEKSFKELAPGAALLSAIVGFLTGGIPVRKMKGEMTSVKRNDSAGNYAFGGLNLRRSDDRFLYANVSKTPIPRETDHRSGSGGGGSSVHFSSSGRSHGGSHGKF